MLSTIKTIYDSWKAAWLSVVSLSIFFEHVNIQWHMTEVKGSHYFWFHNSNLSMQTFEVNLEFY